MDLAEYQGSVDDVARLKCVAAVDQLKCPVVVEDTSLCFDALGGEFATSSPF